ITLWAGISGGAHIILLPEETTKLTDIAEIVKKRKEKGELYMKIMVNYIIEVLKDENIIQGG
ncbi:MAG: ATP-dependent 6-phosphofructokinase, partial [Brevinematia bacterium]